MTERVVALEDRIKKLQSFVVHSNKCLTEKIEAEVMFIA
jgi:hypothetical protein